MGIFYNNKYRTQERQRLRNNATKAEQVLWQYLRGRKINGKKFRRQYGIGSYTVDFYCTELKLVIELDGDSHYSPEGRQHDLRRDAFIRKQGICILRFTNLQVYHDLETVLVAIMRVTTPSNSPL